MHVPFCLSRCDYCAFATWTDRFHLVDAYVDACEADMVRTRRGGMPPVTSVFFGGGTPSLLAPGQIGRLIAALPLEPGAEVTVECNPETVTETKLVGYRDAGVNRLSFGVQSLVPHVLEGLGRRHRIDAVGRAVDAAGAAGFGGHYSVDLIFGGPSESVSDWEASVNAVLDLDPSPNHVSAYALTVEPGTPLAATPERHPDADDQADKYLIADSLLENAGLQWYEISNWAVPGNECRHNQLYWRQGEYLGFGCAAHSHRITTDGTARRWWNVRTPDRYIRLIADNCSPEAAGEDLDQRARRAEALELALRTRRGIPAEAWPGDAALEGLMERDGDRYVLTRRGRLLANEVAIRLAA